MTISPTVESAADVPAAISSVDAAALGEQLSLISTRLDDIEGQLAQVRDSGSAQIQNISETLVTLKKEIAQKPVAKGNATVRDSKPRKVVRTQLKKAVAKPVPSSVVWELRAAQPGKAWVSKSGQSAMRALTVGETLEGVGRIVDISFVNNRWFVQGTKGKIKQ